MYYAFQMLIIINHTVNPSIEPPGALYFNFPKKGGSIRGRGSNRGGGGSIEGFTVCMSRYSHYN
jgi:hypothetical protein